MGADAAREALLAEAYHRGILPAAIRPHYEEAVRRGLVHAPPGVRALADAEQRARVPAGAEPLRQFARQATLGGSEALSAGMSAVGAAVQKGVPLGAAYAAARKVQDEETAERAGAGSTAAGVAGGIASLALGPKEVRAAGGGALGALGGAFEAKQLQDIPGDALKGGLVGAGLGGAGHALSGLTGRAMGRLARPDVALLQREGVQMTPGQLAGGLGKRTEEAARSVPLVGDAITAAHARGVEQFNRAAVGRALKPLGASLPTDVPAGHAAIRHAGDTLGAAYDALLPKGGVQADAELKRLAGKVAPHTATMTQQGKDHLADIVQRLVTSRFKDGRVDGPMYQRIQSELKQAAGTFAKSEQPDHASTAQALKTVSSELQAAASRQNLGFASQLQKVDRGYAHLVIAERAGAKAGAEGGIFSPKQYAAAVREGNDTVRRRGVARGEALGHDLATAGERVLAQKLPDSGTARRLATNGAGGLLAGGGLMAAGGAHALLAAGAGAAAAHAAYSKPAMGALNTAVMAHIAAAGGKPGALALQRHFGALAGQAGRLPAGGQDAPP